MRAFFRPVISPTRALFAIVLGTGMYVITRRTAPYWPAPLLPQTITSAIALLGFTFAPLALLRLTGHLRRAPEWFGLIPHRVRDDEVTIAVIVHGAIAVGTSLLFATFTTPVTLYAAIGGLGGIGMTLVLLEGRHGNDADPANDRK